MDSSIYDAVYESVVVITNMRLSSRTETTGGGVEKIKILSNPDNVMTNMFIAI